MVVVEAAAPTAAVVGAGSTAVVAGAGAITVVAGAGSMAVVAGLAAVPVVAIAEEVPMEVRDPSVEEVRIAAEVCVEDHPTEPAEVPTADSANHAA
jgi:hypothetical protein